MGDCDTLAISGLWTILDRNKILNEILQLIGLADKQNVKVIVMPEPPSLTKSSVINASHKDLVLRYDTGEESARQQNAVFQNIANKSQNVCL